VTSAVQIHAFDHPFVPRTLAQKLAALRLDELAKLPGALGWDDFNKRRGRIEGLQMAIDLCAVVEKELRE
jgi:hypothetical protein